jgi:hypothetical protein
MGRRGPSCAGRPVPRFVKALDAARAQTRLDRQEEEEGYEPRRVEREVGKLIAGRNLDDHGRIAAAQARSLARQVDNLAASRSGSAALGLAAVSRRLDGVTGEGGGPPATRPRGPGRRGTRLGPHFETRLPVLEAGCIWLWLVSCNGPASPGVQVCGPCDRAASCF